MPFRLSFFTSFVLTCSPTDAAQTQYTQPKTHHPERSLRFHMTASVLVNGLTLVYHILVPLSKNPRGVIIDFIGQSKPATYGSILDRGRSTS